MQKVNFISWEVTPVVKVSSYPYGLPMAKQLWPTCKSRDVPRMTGFSSLLSTSTCKEYYIRAKKDGANRSTSIIGKNKCIYKNLMVETEIQIVIPAIKTCTGAKTLPFILNGIKVFEVYYGCLWQYLLTIHKGINLLQIWYKTYV